MMLQNNNKHLQNPDARVFHHPRKFCIKRFRNAVLNIKQNPLKLFVIFLILVRWFLNLLLKSGVEVIVFISLSVKLLLRRGPPEDISNFLNFRFHKVCFAMLCCVMVMYYLKLIVKRNRYFIIQINSNHQLYYVVNIDFCHESTTVDIILMIQMKKIFELYNTPRFFNSLFSKIFKWSVQEKCSSTKTPRYFIEHDLLS